MNEITLKARAKINLGLDIIGVRDDGYHELRMIMQALGLADEVTVRKTNGSGIRLVMPEAKRYLPAQPQKNLAWKAAELLLEEFHPKGGAEIVLVKNIPIAAGLAGGSSDAAAVLKGVNAVFELGLSLDELMARGLKLGADVPYCLLGGTALAEGIGEKLTSLPPAPGGVVVLAKPDFGISTVWSYRRYDEMSKGGVIAHPDIDAIASAIADGDREKMCGLMGNVLEWPAVEEYPLINDIKNIMRSCNAVGTMMSGSGPTVFGIFADEESAADCTDKLSVICRELHKTGFFHGRSTR